MARAHFSLKSTHLLMWSSPILLVVLVFTLTSAATPGPEASLRPPSSTSPVTTTSATPVSTTTTTTTATTATTLLRPSAHRPVTSTTAPTTTPPVALSSSVVTTTTMPRINTAPNPSAMKGEFAGTLSPGFEVVDVPLRGPGDWTVTTSAPANQSLQCGEQTSPVFQQVVVGATQSCQLEISSSSEASLTWQLIPVT